LVIIINTDIYLLVKKVNPFPSVILFIILL